MVTSDGNPIFAGMMWQCVEYARRYLITTLEVAFESIDYAADIWDLTKVTSVIDESQTYPLVNFANGMVLANSTDD